MRVKDPRFVYKDRVRKFSHILPITWKSQVAEWFAEDCESLDCAESLTGDEEKTATLYGKSPGILAGAPFFQEVFNYVGCKVEWLKEEGCGTHDNGVTIALATVTGPLRKILRGKRIALNVLSRCSSIATQTDKMISIARNAGFKGSLAGTRETTPGFRLVEKYGLIIGGADAHRFDLSNLTVVKPPDNLDSWSVTCFMKRIRDVCGPNHNIAVEVSSEIAAHHAIDGGADIIVLNPQKIKNFKLVAWHLQDVRHNKFKFIVECTGNITPENITSFVSRDISILTTSSLHKGVPHVEFSLKLNE
ncbi:Bgt-2091 [Blumeria graminis f. sp. tritici]|uniref:Nicotinate-nucleotide pyrophosphorylase [carboxylating] n=2 Tax=Blumeria graminis f. sp. tritici TaxID=62690 RepID=A0A381L4M7_BLUGR|nr:Quinolinate phosphoribosyl transferase [Blumeria graminis f. sp. tritici 96224]VDB88094.1 Bgt-2091 [Blumeria graminis f. sp. tritici]